jgi:hypothetical protein
LEISKENLIIFNFNFNYCGGLKISCGGGGNVKSQNMKFQKKKEWICFHHGRFCQKNTDGIPDRKK